MQNAKSQRRADRHGVDGTLQTKNDCTTQMPRQADVCHKNNRQLAKNWREKVGLSNSFVQYRKRFFDMLSEFESMSDEHFGRISTTKHRIDITNPNTSPINSAPIWSGPDTRKLEKGEINKMLADNIIEPAQTEWASPIVFVPKERLHLTVLRGLP